MRGRLAISFFLLFVATSFTFAEGGRVDVQVKGRLGLVCENSDYSLNCDYLRLSVKGNFNENLSFVFRQRLNKAITADNPLAATDYLNITWRKGDWELSGGKNYILCGGFDYLSSSCDIHIRPIFFEGCAGMYNFVVHGARYFGNEKLALQFGSSLYSGKPSDLLGGSLFLRGRQGVWEHAYSVNVFEREKGLGNLYFCFGNRLHFGDSHFDIGLTHRMDLSAPTAFKDYSAVSKFRIAARPWMHILGKATWDFKEAGIADPMLPDGTSTWQAGGGFEFFPFANFPNLRLHCICFSRNGETTFFFAGMTLALDILKSASL